MTKNKRITLAFFAVGLVLFIAVPLLAQNAKVYFSQGGDTLTVASGGTLVFAAGSTITGAGLPSTSMTAGMTVTGAAINLNASSNYAVNIATGTSTGTVTVGSGTTTQALVLQSGTGDLTFTSTDDFIWTATDDITLNGGSAGSIINIGTNTQGNVINVGTNNTTKDTINVGSALDDVLVGSGAGAEAASGNVAVERCMGAICQTTMTLTAVAITITDPGGAAAYGGVKLYDFPEGRINRLGIVADLTLTEASGTIAADFDGDISFGSTAADATPTLHNPTTEDDWTPTASTTQAVASVAAADTQSTVTEQTICDGHTTACDLYLNVEIDDADITTGGADALAVSGTVTITWINLGDN